MTGNAAAVPHIFRVVCEIYSMTRQNLWSRCRDPLWVEARVVALYLLRDYGYGLSASGRLMKRSHSTVAHHLTKDLTPEIQECLADARKAVRRALAQPVVQRVAS